jgi:hypothetical protein
MESCSTCAVCTYALVDSQTKPGQLLWPLRLAAAGHGTGGRLLQAIDRELKASLLPALHSPRRCMCL